MTGCSCLARSWSSPGSGCAKPRANRSTTPCPDTLTPNSPGMSLPRPRSGCRAARGCPLGTSRSPRPFRRERLTRRASNVEWIGQVARCESSWRVWAGLYCLRRALVGDFGCVDPPRGRVGQLVDCCCGAGGAVGSAWCSVVGRRRRDRRRRGRACASGHRRAAGSSGGPTRAGGVGSLATCPGGPDRRG